MAKYLGWNDVDRYYHLCACLEEAAGQCYGMQGRRRRRRASLVCYRHALVISYRRNASRLNYVRGDVSQGNLHRLVALAYPSSEPVLVNHVAKEAFITALGDAKLQLKLMERELKTVEDALNLATKLAAYEMSLSLPGRP